MTLLRDIAAASEDVRAEPGRSAKIARLAACLAALAPEEVPAAVAFLSGRLLQRQTGAGWAALRDLPPAAAEPSLTVLEVDAAFARMAAIAGSGSAGTRRSLLHDLFARATEPEQRLLRGLVAGELRQGAQEGVMVAAAARAAAVPVAELRRALMLRGDLGDVTATALRDGAAGLAGYRLEVGRPILPMLAQTAGSVAAALARVGPAAVEWKLDGARIQVHRSGGEVAVFTRTLDEITPRVPEIIEAVLRLPVEAAVLDGEAIALAADGRPLPFQVTAARIAGRRNVEALRGEVPLSAVVFDLLHLDGDDLLDRPGSERFAALAEAAPELMVERLADPDAAAAEAFAADALARGHEGVMVKALADPYEAGRRGAGWLKVKPVHTLDLVVLAAEWGHGRRHGVLSNLHLGARDPEGGFVMLGKTFKGLTDEMLRWQTERLLELESGREGHVVHVRPELVVEIAFDGIQRSPRYPGGVALRFARVKRHRPDKRAQDADTIAAVLAIHAAASGAVSPQPGPDRT
ncbi:MAG TPA: ATP-dependent DNA ligase [Gaiellales bacterium]